MASTNIQIGPKSGVRSGACLNMLHHDSYTVRYFGAKALGRIGDRTAIPVLVEALQHDENFSVRATAAESLGALRASEAIPALERAVREDSFMRETARRVLEELRRR